MTRRCCAHRRHAAGICLSGFCACQRPMTAKARKAMERWSAAEPPRNPALDPDLPHLVNNGRISRLRRARDAARRRRVKRVAKAPVPAKPPAKPVVAC